jgi:hypothetical protein
MVVSSFSACGPGSAADHSLVTFCSDSARRRPPSAVKGQLDLPIDGQGICPLVATNGQDLMAAVRAPTPLAPNINSDKVFWAATPLWPTTRLSAHALAMHTVGRAPPCPASMLSSSGRG